MNKTTDLAKVEQADADYTHTSMVKVDPFKSDDPAEADRSKEKTEVLDLSPIYSALTTAEQDHVTKRDLLDLFAANGISRRDRRIRNVIVALDDYALAQPIPYEEFCEIIQHSAGIVERCAKRSLIIPDFRGFAQQIERIVEQVRENKGGKVADYIPQLKRVAPEHLAVSICTIDGQRLDFGDSDKYFCVQSTCKPISYCIAMELNGEDYVHKHVGREPSGRSFNEISLNRHNLPHNPMINAGAIMCSSMIKPDKGLADRFDLIMSVWKELSGGRHPGYNNSVYHSEKETADRNFALAHFMREVGAFPEGTDIGKTLDFYFQNCSIEVNSRSMATIAATFANSGVNPLTNKRVFSNESVKNCLSLMYSCGMYDFSGEFAFSVGLPAKSGVSGALMLVVPNLMGITIWSPRLDVMGNSVRGVQFCQELVKTFNFHNYDGLVSEGTKIDPRRNESATEANRIFGLIFAASQGDLNEIRRLISHGVDVNSSDYDGRTALHLAAAEGQTETVKFLLRKGADKDYKDRWGNTPMADAQSGGHEAIAELLN